MQKRSLTHFFTESFAGRLKQACESSDIIFYTVLGVPAGKGSKQNTNGIFEVMRTTSCARMTFLEDYYVAR